VHKFKFTQHKVSSLLLLEFHCCRAVIQIAEGTGSEVNPRVDLPLALVVLALPRVCLLPSIYLVHCVTEIDVDNQFQLKILLEFIGGAETQQAY